MKILKDRILKESKVQNGDLIKVGSFLNHQVDIDLMNKIGKEFQKRFKDTKVDKILTAEVSGIAIAAIVAQYFNVPMVFARKTKSHNLSKDVYATDVYSFTGKKTYKIKVSKEYLKRNENILIVDDFLANGQAVKGLIKLVNKADANLAGVGVVIEKGFQLGGEELRKEGINLESLAIIESVEDGIRFR